MDGCTLKFPSGFHGQSVRNPGVLAIEELSKREELKVAERYGCLLL